MYVESPKGLVLRAHPEGLVLRAHPEGLVLRAHPEGLPDKLLETSARTATHLLLALRRAVLD